MKMSLYRLMALTLVGLALPLLGIQRGEAAPSAAVTSVSSAVSSTVSKPAKSDKETCFSRAEFLAVKGPMSRARLERVTETTGLAVPDPHPTTLAGGATEDSWFYPDCRFDNRLLIQVIYVDGMWDLVAYPSRYAVEAGYAIEA